MNLVPDRGLRPSVVDSGIERCSELGPEAESKNRFEENWMIPKAANMSHLTQEHFSSQRCHGLPLGRADEVLHSPNVSDELHTLHGHALFHKFCYALLELGTILAPERRRYPGLDEVVQSLRDIVHFRTELESDSFF